MRRIGVMHLVDTLWAGGAERVAVDLVNHLPRDRYAAYLCTTRRDGPLEELVAADVIRLRLARARRFDPQAVRRLVAFVRAHDVRILHAHGPALLLARAAALFEPRPAVVWHVHFGGYATGDRSALPYRLLTAGVAGVVAVSEPLAAWARRRLPVPERRIRYVPNLVTPIPASPGAPLPGMAGARIVCVANFRPEKDQLSLVRAMVSVRRHHPDAHLLLVGGVLDAGYADAVRREIVRSHLAEHVSLLGQRLDVGTILAACDVGVLSSASEGLPLALIEYGMARLPVVVTNVGECGAVVDRGAAGLIVPPGNPSAMADALVALLSSPDRRRTYANRFHEHVRRTYGPERVMGEIAEVYEECLRQAGIACRVAAGATAAAEVAS